MPVLMDPSHLDEAQTQPLFPLFTTISTSLSSSSAPMASSKASSSKPSRFDPLKLLSEIQAAPSAPTSSSNAPSTTDQDEEDFMSDSLLPTASSSSSHLLTYTDKRRKLDAHHSRSSARRSLKEREEEAREEGLGRDLLAEAEIVAGGGTLPPESRDGRSKWEKLARDDEGKVFAEKGEGEDGTTKAMRMMLAMGYRRGQALGKRSQPAQEEGVEEEEEDDEPKTTAAASPPDTDPEPLDSDEEAAAAKARADSDAREEDEYLSGGISAPPSFSAPLLNPSSSSIEPLRPDQRWLDNRHRRAGIGMIPRTHPTTASAIRSKASASLSTPSQVRLESDFRHRISHEHSQRHHLALLLRARKTLIDLDLAAGTQYSPLWLDAQLYLLLSGQSESRLDQGTIDERMERDAAFKEAIELLWDVFGSEDEGQREEAKLFCNLEVKAQLELVLESLRRQHRYCLFCGCQYRDEEDMAQNCPGEMEEDHD